MAVVDAMAVQLQDSEYEEPSDTTGNADSSDTADETANTPVPSVASVDPNAAGADRF